MKAVFVWNGRVAEPLSTRLRSPSMRDASPVEALERRSSFDLVADLHERATPECPDEPPGRYVVPSQMKRASRTRR